LYDASTAGRVFKYPPWTLPLFFPFGFISFNVARVLWALVEIASIAYTVCWLKKAGVTVTRTLWLAISFWWIWLGHFYTGQITVFLLAISLWAVSPKISSPRATILALFLTTKVFHAVSLVGILKDMLRPRTLIAGVLALIALDVLTWEVLRIQGSTLGWLELHRQWIQAAGSAASELGAEVVRGQGNHSFTAGVLRWCHVDPLDTSKDIWVAALLAVFLSALWHHFSRVLDPAESWAGWLCVGLVIHPLLWHHSFVLAFPACVLAMDRALKSGSRGLIAAAGTSIFLVALLIPQLFGSLVNPFEWAASKSWGVTLACAVLVIYRRRFSGTGAGRGRCAS
jgi:hypothetical protein